jgi:predicted amidohydrolase
MVRVAAVQMQPAILDTDANLAHLLGLVQDSAAHDARLIVFPEIALSGYAITSDEAEALAQPVPGPATDAITRACHKTGAHVVLGLLERDRDGTLFNAAVLLGPSGLLSHYRKTHLPLLGVDRYLAAGDGLLPPVETPAGRVGLLICYDLRFPEPCRVLALLGAQLITLSTAWPMAGTLYPDYLARARAAENRTFLIAANRCGEERGTRYLGRSVIVAPDGTLLAEAAADREQTLYADIDPTLSDTKRLVFAAGEYELDLWGDRRPDLYGPIASDTLAHP